jgi:hypothetical protein
MTDHGMSQRRACAASGIARSTLRYICKASDDSGVIQFIQTYMATNPRHGFGLLYASPRHQGQDSTVACVLPAQSESAQAGQEATACAYQATP